MSDHRTFVQGDMLETGEQEVLLVIADISGYTKFMTANRVILVHRLLKNGVTGDEYVLLSDAARADLFAPDESMFEESVERYEDIGPVRTFVYRPHSRRADYPAGSFDGPVDRWKTHQIKNWAARLLNWGLLRVGKFNHLPDRIDSARS